MSNFVRVKENFEFRRAYKKGTSLVTPFAVVYVTKNRTSNIRLGITAGKKIGKAVQRNRAKRVIRAAFRELLPSLIAGYDYIIVARVKILTVKSTVVKDALRKAFASADLLRTENE